MTGIAAMAQAEAGAGRRNGTIVEEGVIEAEETVARTVDGNAAAKRALEVWGTIIVTSERDDEVKKSLSGKYLQYEVDVRSCNIEGTERHKTNNELDEEL